MLNGTRSQQQVRGLRAGDNKYFGRDAPSGVLFALGQFHPWSANAQEQKSRLA
jgi:hypothetical protein